MPFPELNAGEKKRDMRLRRKLLHVVHAALRYSPTGSLAARLAVDEAADLMPEGQGFDSDSHALTLLRELVNSGFLNEQKSQLRRRGESFGLDHLSYRITDAGTRLLAEKLPPNPLVDDERISE